MKCFILAALMLVVGCSLTVDQPGVQYSARGREFIYAFERWRLEGRIAIQTGNDAWTANLIWQSVDGVDRLRLSGPLGQGAVEIEVSEQLLSIGRGNGIERYYHWTNEFIARQLGFDVPVHALRYWLMGLPLSTESADYQANGFRQLGWLVEYKQMQSVEAGRALLPKKMVVTGPGVKLKLIINQWDLNG